MSLFEAKMWYHAVLQAYEDLSHESDLFEDPGDIFGEWADSIRDEWPGFDEEWYTKPIDW